MAVATERWIFFYFVGKTAVFFLGAIQRMVHQMDCKGRWWEGAGLEDYAATSGSTVEWMALKEPS